MPGQTTSPPLAVTVLAALFVGSCRCGAPATGCDDTKLSWERDLLAADAVPWDCPVPAFPASTQTLSSIDTVYDAEPARQMCMDKPISYSHSIPNSGAYRPTRAENGEYLYCPPQRWLNNVHHGAIAVLYHPCAPSSELLRLTALARSCLPDYIMTPHPQLSKHMPIALVSWGRTLELSTAVSSDVCDWLHDSTTTGKMSSSLSRGHKYNLLLTWSAHLEGHATKTKESLKRCCEQTISSLPDAELRSASDGKRQIPTLRKRQRRATVRDEHHGVPGVSGTDEGRVSTSTIVSETGTNGADDARRPAAGPKQQFGVNASEAVERRPESPDLSSKDGTERRTASVRRRVKDGGDDGEITDDDEVVGVKEREVEKHGHTHLAKSGDSLARNQPNPRQSDPSGCDGCKEGERCDCVKGSGTTGESNGLPRTRRTDEAVWAAAALGFLLVLLALSVLHTRLYRHWRAPPSLYWHDPQQDYDSVADILRRRLRNAKTRRKRGRRQECVLLPSSSSSEELL